LFADKQAFVASAAPRASPVQATTWTRSGTTWIRQLVSDQFQSISLMMFDDWSGVAHLLGRTSVLQHSLLVQWLLSVAVLH